jgi:hypothetical protein
MGGVSNKTTWHITQDLDLTYFSRSQRSKLKKSILLLFDLECSMVSLASGAEVRFVPPVRYSTLDAGCFCRYPVQNSLYFNANDSVVLWSGSFVDFRRWFWGHSGSGLTVQLGRAWCTLPVSGWVWRRSETAGSLGTQSIASSRKKAAMTPYFHIKY